MTVKGAQIYYQDIKSNYRLYVYQVNGFNGKPSYQLAFYMKLSDRPERWLNCTGNFLPTLKDAQGIVDICKTAQLK